MEWVNIPSNGIWGGIKCNRLGKWGTVKRFLFFSFSEFVVQLNYAISGYQKGLAGFEINRKIFRT
jgi:hypothetical protein